MNEALRGVSPKEYRQSLAGLLDQGWDVAKTPGGHLRMSHPDAASPIFASSTTSDKRTIQNTLACCRRALRSEGMRFNPMIKAPAAFLPLSEPMSDHPLKPRKSRGLKLADRLALEASQVVCEKPAQEILPTEATKDIPMTMHAKVVADTSTLPVAENLAAAPVATAPVVVPTATITTPGPLAIEPVARPQPLRVVGATARRVSSVSHIDQSALDLAMRIMRGELTSLVITQDMVGASLWYTGDITLAHTAAPVAPVAKPVADTAAVTHGTEVKDAKKRIGKHDDDVMKVITAMSPDWLSPVQIISLLIADGSPVDHKTWNGLVYQILYRLHDEGRIQLDPTATGRKKRYRKAA